MSNIDYSQTNKKRLFIYIKEIFYFLKDNKNKKVRKHFRSGMNYIQKEDFQNAIEEFNKVINIKPDHFLARVYLARLYRIKGENLKAFKEYSYVQKINLVRYKTYNLMNEHLKLTRIYEDRGLLDEVANNLEKCARNLTEVAEKMHRAAKKQHNATEKLTNINKKFKIKSLDVKKLDIKIEEYGDFKDMDEYIKFLTLPPIAEEEKRNTDWDQVISKILE